MRFILYVIRGVARRLQFFYEAVVAPFIARYLYWFLWPVYFYLKKRNIVFVVNIAPGAGHIFFELDNYFRMIFLKDIDDRKKYVWVNKKDYFVESCIKLYGHKFSWAVSHTFIYNFFLPITMRYKDLVLDCGCSRLKWQLPLGVNFPYFSRQTRATFIYQIPKNLGLEQVNRYYQRLKKSVGFYPMKPSAAPSREFLEFLNEDGRKIALIHAKDTVRNATAIPTDPYSYLDAICYLQQLGYRVIFVGREKMPEVFKKYSLLDYASSPITSYENDIHLFHRADVMIMSGSGISVVPDCLDKFFLYLNSWHLAIPAFSGKSIHVPTIVRKKNGHFLTFREQNTLYRSMEDQGAETFPQRLYEPKNASSDEILEALKELLELKNKFVELNPLQIKFRCLDEKAPLFYANSRCSSYFLNKYSGLLDVS